MIHYIIATYLGERRFPICEDHSLVLKKHLEVLSTAMHSINKITVVLNFDNEMDIHRANAVINGFPDLPLNLICRENTGYSYAAWDQAIIESISDNEIEFYVLMEDDYAPASPLFYEPFLEKFKSNDRMGYVCSVIFENPRHAAISNGILKKSVAEDLLEKTGKIFNIVRGSGYESAESTQTNFLKNMESQGYLFEEAGRQFRWPFNSAGNLMIIGNEYGEEIISTIMEV